MNKNYIIGGALIVGGGLYYAYTKGLLDKFIKPKKNANEENQAAIDAIAAEQEAARIAAANAARIAAAARQASSLDNPNSYAGKVAFIQSDIGCGLIDGNPGTKAGSETNLKYAAKYGLDKGIISPNNIDYYKSKVVNKLTLVAQKAAAAVAAKKAASVVNVANDAKRFLELVNKGNYKATANKDFTANAFTYDALKKSWININEPRKFKKGDVFSYGQFRDYPTGAYVMWFKGGLPNAQVVYSLKPTDFLVTL